MITVIVCIAIWALAIYLTAQRIREHRTAGLRLAADQQRAARQQAAVDAAVERLRQHNTDNRT